MECRLLVVLLFTKYRLYSKLAAICSNSQMALRPPILNLDLGFLHIFLPSSSNVSIDRILMNYKYKMWGLMFITLMFISDNKTLKMTITAPCDTVMMGIKHWLLLTSIYSKLWKMFMSVRSVSLMYALMFCHLEC